MPLLVVEEVSAGMIFRKVPGSVGTSWIGVLLQQFSTGTFWAEAFPIGLISYDFLGFPMISYDFHRSMIEVGS